MNKKLFWYLPIFILLIACTNKNKISWEIKMISNAANEQFPMAVDAATIVTSVEASPGNVLKYNYKLNLKSPLTDTLRAIEHFKRINLYNLEDNRTLKILKDVNATIIHSYNDISGKHLFDVVLTPTMYRNRNNKTQEITLSTLITDAVFFNKLLFPIVIDNTTELYDCRYDAPDTLTLIYNVDETKIQMNDLSIPMMKEYLIKSTKNDNSLREERDKGCIFKHIFHFKDGKITSVIITSKDYKRKILQ